MDEKKKRYRYKMPYRLDLRHKGPQGAFPFEVEEWVRVSGRSRVKRDVRELGLGFVPDREVAEQNNMTIENVKQLRAKRHIPCCRDRLRNREEARRLAEEEKNGDWNVVDAPKLGHKIEGSTKEPKLRKRKRKPADARFCRNGGSSIS